jgi:hypothetical protein
VLKLPIGSIHVSLLSGRILLRDVRYHSSNQTAKMVKAQITWRYWIRKPTTEEELSQARIGEGDGTYSCTLWKFPNSGESFVHQTSNPIESSHVAFSYLLKALSGFCTIERRRMRIFLQICNRTLSAIRRPKRQDLIKSHLLIQVIISL